MEHLFLPGRILTGSLVQCKLQRCILIEPVAVVKWSETCYLFEHSTEGFQVCITYFIHDFRNILPARFQHFLCLLYPHPLLVLCRRIACCLNEAPVEIPAAQRKFGGELFHGNFIREVLFDI